jgi:hypothetical protein
MPSPNILTQLLMLFQSDFYAVAVNGLSKTGGAAALKADDETAPAGDRAPRANHAPPAPRRRFSLDGGGWQLQLDPSDAKVATMATNGSKVAGPVSVPGAWCAQGFGQETAQLHSQYSGTGFYSRLVAVPPAMLPHRSVNVNVGGAFVGNHTGYLSSFEADITGHAAASLNISLALSSEPGGTDGMWIAMGPR